MGNELLTIGTVAKRARVNIQTVRYYERRRLVFPDDHRDSGYRLYSDEAVRKIRFVRNAQDLGFTLSEIMSLLKLRVSKRSQCEKVKRKAEDKLADVRAKIGGLKAIEKVLSDLIRTCHAQDATDSCPILRSLELEHSAGRT